MLGQRNCLLEGGTREFGTSGLQNFGILVLGTSISSRLQIWGNLRELTLRIQVLGASGLRNIGASERQDQIRHLGTSGLQNYGNSRVFVFRISLFLDLFVVFVSRAARRDLRSLSVIESEVALLIIMS